MRRNDDRGRKQQGRERERKEMKERKRWGCRKVRGIMRKKRNRKIKAKMLRVREK